MNRWLPVCWGSFTELRASLLVLNRATCAPERRLLEQLLGQRAWVAAVAHASPIEKVCAVEASSAETSLIAEDAMVVGESK
jgi:hypothetical protein